MRNFFTLALALAIFSQAQPASAATLLTGSADASVQILVFGDLQCPYTKKFMSYVEKFEADYGNRVGLLFSHYPLSFHAQAKPAAIAAECASQQGHFREFMNLAFAHQTEFSRDFFVASAKSAGVPDSAAYAACLDSDNTAHMIQSEYASGVAAGVSGTPNIFINGEKISGVYPYADFKAAIDKALKNF